MLWLILIIGAGLAIDGVDSDKKSAPYAVIGGVLIVIGCLALLAFR
jgi:hypothetical protein